MTFGKSNIQNVNIKLLLSLLWVATPVCGVFNCHVTIPPYRGPYNNKDVQIDFYEKHADLITCGLRRVVTGKTSADFTLVVYHRRSDPYEVTIENIKERSDAPFYAIRLFMKPEKRMFVAYESKSGETVIAEYQLRRNRLVNIGIQNAGKYVEAWRITDSEEGFYDAVTCQMFGTKNTHPKCPCLVELYNNRMCIYDYFRKVYEQITKYGSATFLLTFNIYNCLHFHEGNNEMKWICNWGEPCNENITSTSFITAAQYLADGEYGICLDATDNVRQLQFYDLKWDVPGRLPESVQCGFEYVRTIADMANKMSYSNEVEENEVDDKYQPQVISPTIQNNKNIIKNHNEGKICWSPSWTVTLFCLDGVLIFTAIFVCFLAGGIGRNAKRQKY